MIENLHKKTGKTLQQWIEIVKKNFLKHGEIIKFLKEQHEFTHGFANLVAHKANETDAGSAENQDELILKQYEGKEHLKPFYNLLKSEMSKFGKDAIESAGIETLYVPHAIDTNIFKATELVEGSDGAVPARQWMGVPEDAYCITMVSANKGSIDRKGFAEAFLAAGMFMQDHADVWLYLHTEPSPAMSGLDLRALLTATGVPADRVAYADNYSYRMGIPKEALAAIYTASDVLLQPSRGEGFGIPSLESQATGTPVIVSNATAQPELVGDGWLVDVQPAWDAPQGCWFFTPLVPSIVDALGEAYARGRIRSDKAREFALQYDADLVYDKYWRPALDIILTP